MAFLSFKGLFLGLMVAFSSGPIIARGHGGRGGGHVGIGFGRGHRYGGGGWRGGWTLGLGFGPYYGNYYDDCWPSYCRHPDSVRADYLRAHNQELRDRISHLEYKLEHARNQKLQKKLQRKLNNARDELNQSP